MAHNQSENGRDKTTDEYGNPIRRTEDSVHHHGVTEATTGNGTHDTMTGSGNHETTGTGHKTPGTNVTGNRTHGRATGPTGFAATTAGGQGRFLHNRSDGSSNSSEDDGNGGRRWKMSLKEKTKETLPPGGKSDHSGTTNTPPVDTIQGMMDKIKEKLPGGNSNHGGTNNTPPVDSIPHEKKGMMDKIKGELPGGNSDHGGTTNNTPPSDTIPMRRRA